MSSFPRVIRVLFVFVTISSLFVDGQKSYFDEIKDAMHSLKSFLHTGLDGLAKLAKTIEVVEQFVDATIDEDCEPYTCPKGFNVKKIIPWFAIFSQPCFLLKDLLGKQILHINQKVMDVDPLDTRYKIT
jgi:hypothetical protein